MKVIRKEAKKLTVNTIEVREPVVEDLIRAEMIAGTSEGLKFALALISEIALFDGKKYTMEDLMHLGVRDFLGLSKAISGFGLEELAKELSSSQGKETLDSQKS